MGSTDSIPQNNSLRLNRDNWESFLPEDPEPPGFVQTGYKRIKNKMTGEELDQYSLTFTDYDDYKNYLEILNFRNKSQFIAKAVYINQQKVNQFCSMIINLHVYIEHFPLRLCNVQAIPFPQNLYVLIRALQGFKQLFSQFGYFNITQDLICINQQGIVKVWINSNLSNFSIQSFHNEAQYNRFLKKVETGSENSMIWGLLTIVDQITNPLSLPQNTSFINYLGKLNKSHLSFDSTERLIHSYARNFKARIPQLFQSTLKVMREKKGIFDSQIDLSGNKINEEVDFAIRGNRFKESTVQRVESIKNNSIRSYAASESNRTFADKLKKFDNSYKNMKTQFSNAFYQKESPSLLASGIINKNQSLTERIPILNQKSSSSVQFPSTNSLIAQVSSKNVVNNLVSPINNSSSDIISHKKNNMVLFESQQKSKSPTYFSQYIDQMQQTKIAKKATLFSFAGADEIPSNKHKTQGAIKDFKGVIVSQSLENSKTQQTNHNKQAPITFSYNQEMKPKFPSEKNLHWFRSSSNQSSFAESKKNQQSFDELSSMPFSPPSVDKRSSHFQYAKVNGNINVEKDDKKHNQQNFFSLFKKRDYAQQVVQSVCEKVNCSQFMLENLQLQKSEILIHSVKQKIHNFPEEQINNSKKAQVICKQYQKANSSEKVKKQITQKCLKNKKKQISIFEKHLILKKKQFLQKEQKEQQEEQKNALSLYNEYQIDPDIVFDLLNLQKKQKKEKKY